MGLSSTGPGGFQKWRLEAAAGNHAGLFGGGVNARGQGLSTSWARKGVRRTRQGHVPRLQSGGECLTGMWAHSDRNPVIYIENMKNSIKYNLMCTNNSDFLNCRVSQRTVCGGPTLPLSHVLVGVRSMSQGAEAPTHRSDDGWG